MRPWISIVSESSKPLAPVPDDVVMARVDFFSSLHHCQLPTTNQPEGYLNGFPTMCETFANSRMKDVANVFAFSVTAPCDDHSQPGKWSSIADRYKSASSSDNTT